MAFALGVRAAIIEQPRNDFIREAILSRGMKKNLNMKNKKH